MNGRQGADPIYTQGDWSGIGSGIANALGQVFGFGASPGPQAQTSPTSSTVAKPLRADHPASASITAPGAIAARTPIAGDQRAIAARKAR